MAVTPSLGQAVALQGRNQVAEKLGQLEFQSQQNAKNRAARLGAVEAKKAGDEQQQLYKLFNDRASFSRLVQPKLQVLIDDVMTKAMTIQSSGSPSRSNEFNKVIADAYVEMSNLKMRSDAFKDFDTKIATIDKNKTFFGPQTEEFITKYYKNPNIKDYDQLAAAVRKDNFKFDNNLMLTAEGVPLFNPEPIENYQEKIATLGRSIKPTVASTQMVSLPYDKKSMTSSLVRPFKKEDAKNAYNNNPALYPQGLPVSVEDVVETYMLSNPRAVDQYVSRNKLNFIKDSETGMYSEQDEVKIKEGMMNFALQFTNPEIKDKVISKGGGVNIFGPSSLQSPLAPQPTREVIDFGLPGEKLNDKKLEANDKRKNKVLEAELIGTDYTLNVPGITLKISNKVFDRAGNEISKNLSDQTLRSISTYPYKMVNVKGQLVPRIAYRGEEADIVGIMPFAEIGSPGEAYFKPLDSFTSSELAGSKFDVAKLDPYIKDIQRRSKQATDEIKGKKILASTIYTILQNSYNK